MNKETAPIENAPYISMEELDFDKEEKKAKSFIHDHNFQEALRSLQEEGLLPHQVLQVKERYSESLESADFMTEGDWEYLTMMSLYSPELATHCVETYKLIRTKIESIRIGSETIAEIIQKETGSLDTFYRAALLHDIGKMNIPESVLNHKMDVVHMQAEPNDAEAAQSVSDYDFHKNSTEPARTFLSEEQIQELIQRGISPDLTFREILNLHEQASQEILEEGHLPVEAKIVGQHHNYSKTPLVYPASSTAIGVTSNQEDLTRILLHLGDVQEALRSPDRRYKKSFSPITTSYELKKDAEESDDPLKKMYTALWIQNDMGAIKANLSEGDREKLDELEAFLKKYLPN